MRRFDIEEMGAGCTAKYIFSKGLIIPCIFVEARSLSNKKEANKFCRRAAKKIKKTINSKFVTVYESVEYFK